MIFNKHSEIEGKHALLSPSKWSWLNYNEDEMLKRYESLYSQNVGTLVHEFASFCIKENEKLKKGDKRTLYMFLKKRGIPKNAFDEEFIFPTLMDYVNDAIGFRMESEQPLKYSSNCFGTADAISFKDNILRIHDLKTGSMPAHIEQLEIYAALFCLEYNVDPMKINIELRIYQNGDILGHIPDGDDILQITKKIVELDNVLNEIKRGA